jgi:hypothetical protein
MLKPVYWLNEYMHFYESHFFHYNHKELYEMLVYV